MVTTISCIIKNPTYHFDLIIFIHNFMCGNIFYKKESSIFVMVEIIFINNLIDQIINKLHKISFILNMYNNKKKTR